MNLGPVLDLVKETALEAGAIALSYFRQHYEIAEKGEENPVTTADLAVNQRLKERLLKEYPSFGWCSEETPLADEPSFPSPCWIIDPIDGTKEFIAGLPEFAISVGLAVDRVMMLGVVHNPATGQLYHAVRGEGAYLNGAPVRMHQSPLPEAGTLLVSRTEQARGDLRALEGRLSVLACGSIAWKLARLSAGDGDATVSVRPKHLWDIAAGLLLVQEAGGKVTDLDGKEIGLSSLKQEVSGIIAAHPDRHDALTRLVRKATDQPT